MIKLTALLSLSIFMFSTNVVAKDDACMEVSLTGTQGGPSLYKGLAGAGTLVKVGTMSNGCSDVHLQFDVGRATSLRLAELDVNPNMLDAVFLTHLHSDHTVGLVDLAQTRWHSFAKTFDLVCSADVDTKGPFARTMSCQQFAAHIADAALYAGEISQRTAESKKRNPKGPHDLINVIPVALTLPNKPRIVWQSGDVIVRAIASTHIPGHLSYRVDSPAGSVVIGGDAGNKESKPPRKNSTSAGVELLSKDADVLVHSTIHPVMGPDTGSTFPAAIFYRQSTSTDLGALAKRANVSHLMLTHLIPPISAKKLGRHLVPGGALTDKDYLESTRKSGYKGQVYVGKDLMTLRLPL